ncbi:MAG: DUF421 domain-containing protein [Bacillota bacterium]
MLVSFLRTIILFSLVVFAVRMMGKREQAQLQPFEIVIAVMLAELAGIPMADMGIPLLFGVIPILTILLIHYVISTLMLHSERARAILCGRPTIVIERGRIRMDELKRLRCNLNDLLEQLRSQQASIESVEYAIFEPGGSLSIILKSPQRPLTPADMCMPSAPATLPTPIVLDGKMHDKNLRSLGHNEGWFKSELEKLGYHDIKNVTFATIDEKQVLIVQGSGPLDTLQKHTLQSEEQAAHA